MKTATLIVFSGVLAVCSGGIIPQKDSTVVGSEKCSWGPSYWCSGITTSKECSATSHCIAKKWSAMPALREDKSVGCTLCRDFVDIARKTGKNAQEAVMAAFIKTCELNTDEHTRKYCVATGEELVSEFMQLYNSTLDADVVCKVLNLCHPRAKLSAQIATKNAESTEVANSGPIICEFCLATFSYLRQFAETHTEEQFHQELTRTCERIIPQYLFILEGQCLDLVENSHAEAYKIIKEASAEVFCQGFHLCPKRADEITTIESSLMKVSTEVSTEGPMGCEFCLAIYGSLRQYAETHTEDQFHKELMRMCTQLPFPLILLETECLMEVEGKHAAVYGLIKKATATQFCQGFGFCPKNADEITTDVSSLMKVSTEVSTKYPEVCALCMGFYGKLRKFAETHNEFQFHQELILKCEHLPLNFYFAIPPCIFEVEQYHAEMYKLIKMVNAASFCQGFHFCPRKNETITTIESSSIQNANKDIESTEVSTTDDKLCNVCLDGYGKLKKFAETHNEEQFNQELIRICAHLPPAFLMLKPICILAQKGNHDLKLYLRIKEVPASDFCKGLGMCKNTDKARCSHCRFVANMLTDNAQDLCKEETYCQESSSLNSLNPFSAFIKTSDGKCDSCEKAVTTLKNVLNDKKIEKKAIEDLKKVCEKLPLPEKAIQVCKKHIDDDIAEIMKKLAGGLEPKTICKMLLLC